MTTIFNSNFDYAKPFSDTGMMVSLGATVEEVWTVPGESWQRFRAEFSFNESADVWVALNKTAVLPTAGTVTDINQQELRPEPKYVKGGDVLHFITSGANIQCGVSLLLLPSPK